MVRDSSNAVIRSVALSLQRGFRQLFAAGDGCWDVTNFLRPAGEAAVRGEGVLILSATPASDRSTRFADQYEKRYGPITNYAVNSYDATRVLLAAMQAAAKPGSALTRKNVVARLKDLRFSGVAYERPVAWDEKNDNLAAVTALYVADDGRFRQLAVL